MRAKSSEQCEVAFQDPQTPPRVTAAGLFGQELMEQAPWLLSLPPGYRFAPTPRELILYYLNPWVASPAGHTPFGQNEGILCAADVYSADPGTLTSGLRYFGHDDGNWYFLCVARWKDGNAGTRISRAVQGGGTWHGSGKRIRVSRHGYRQTFEYRVPGGSKSAWLMEEIGSNLPEATGAEGVKVLCRVHRTPRAAADDDAKEEGQETDEVDQLRSSKKRQCEQRQEHDFATANYCAAGPTDGVGCSYASTSSQTALVNAAAPTGGVGCSYASTSQTTALVNAAAPTDVGCSYAGTSQTALVNAAAPTTWQQQQQQPLMIQGATSYHCTGVNGGVNVNDEQQLLDVLLPDEEWQQFEEVGYGFAQLDDELMRDTFSCPKPSDGAVRENGDPRGEKRTS